MSIQADTVEGRLAVYLAPERGGARIGSSRPLHAARIFEGRTVGETLRALPLLFSVCGQAQTYAALRAIESATAQAASPEVDQGRAMLRSLETLREHLWRVLLEWPGFCGASVEQPLLMHLMSLIRRLRDAIDGQQQLLRQPGLQRWEFAADRYDETLSDLVAAINDRVFGMSIDAWLAFDAAAFGDWVDSSDHIAARMLGTIERNAWQGLGTTQSDALPPLPASDLCDRLDGADADSYIAEPSWGETVYETGPAARQWQVPLLAGLRRQYGNGLLARMLARLIELAQLARQLRDRDETADTLPETAGLSQIEAARGRLCHRVIVDGGRIVRYRILAPTEWNFKPGGPANRALSTLRERKQATQLANLLIHAIDPCVGYDLYLDPA